MNGNVYGWGLVVASAVASSACSGGGADELEVTVHQAGDVVTIDWSDPRPVHMVYVVPTIGDDAGRVTWRISASEEFVPAPDTPPTIVPPIVYGEAPEAAHVLTGPSPLVSGISYRVWVDQSGWGAACNDQGIPVATATGRCSLGTGTTYFRFDEE